MMNDDTVWCDFARFYTLGVFGRGKKALESFGVWEDVKRASAKLVGSQSWRGNNTNATVSFYNDTGREPIYALPRDKLASALYDHILEHYRSQIKLHYNYRVDPIDFEYSNDGVVLLEISPCNNACLDSSQAGVQKKVSKTRATTNFLIGADGPARTVANKMEDVERVERQSMTPLKRLLAGRPFHVKRFEDDNPRVYKTLPIQVPSDWRADVGYNANDGMRRFAIVSLPANTKVGYCAILLMKKGEALASGDTDPKDFREMLDTSFPVFSKLLSDEEVATVAKKPPSNFPFYRYAGPRLHKGQRTVILGDSAHSVKPYNGLGVNSAFEDVRILGDIIDKTESLKDVVEEFSRVRARDSKAVVTLSRAGDRPGRLGFLSYLVPIVMDAMFHKAAPAIFAPPVPALMHNEKYTFHQVAAIKRRDRLVQVSIIAVSTVLIVRVAKLAIRSIAAALGKRDSSVAMGLAFPFAALFLTRRYAIPAIVRRTKG
jgi:2-polyprenyl-6-methoxyphenol hydroxylase-like FAD-dependent oxidoreductase